MTLPNLPTPQAPAVSVPSGTLTREWFLLLQGLLTAVTAMDARLTAQDAALAAQGIRLTALEA